MEYLHPAHQMKYDFNNKYIRIILMFILYYSLEFNMFFNVRSL